MNFGESNFFTTIYFMQKIPSYAAFPGHIIHVRWGTPCKYKLFRKCAYVRVHLFFLERCCKYFMRESHKLRLAGLSPDWRGKIARVSKKECTTIVVKYDVISWLATTYFGFWLWFSRCNSIGTDVNWSFITN